VLATIGGGAMLPGGFLLPWPLPGAAGHATIDGKTGRIAADGRHIPARNGPIWIVMERKR